MNPRTTRLAAIFPIAILTLLLPILGGCKGWTMDYGRPAAQFEARDTITLAPDHMRKKVSVRGRVSSVNTSDPENCIVKLDHGVTAHFGKFKAMAESCKVGKIVHLDGIVKTVSPSSVTLDPAFGRDPQAPFDPVRP